MHFYNQKLNNVVRGVDTYWLSKPLRTVFNHKHSLYLDGGTEDLRWGADFSYNSGERRYERFLSRPYGWWVVFILSTWRAFQVRN